MNPTLWLVATSIGTVVLVALGVIYRRAAAQRELEIAEEVIEDDYRALDQRRVNSNK